MQTRACDILDIDAQLATRTAVQFVFFDAYDEWLREERTYPLQVVGFASTLSLCSDDAAWELAQAELFGAAAPGQIGEPGKPMRLADQGFLPHGMFGNEGDLRARARATVTGQVVSLSHPTNQLSGQRFTWARVASMMGELDIVAPFTGEVARTDGMRALADVWLVGHPEGSPPRPGKRSLWRRLLGRS
ncbi:MAG TPA: hypothetical protein VLC09_15560 [Polyangiaceae bacterium]|nr:hypothetical protein [Polyangiaceae bacterium]